MVDSEHEFVRDTIQLSTEGISGKDTKQIQIILRLARGSFQSKTQGKWRKLVLEREPETGQKDLM